jgi:hypothetical protein
VSATGEVEPAPPLRSVLVKLAHDDPTAAARLLAGLLPVQAAVIDVPLSYDLTIAEIGTFGIELADGAVRASRQPRPRGRRQAAFHLRADALTLAELLAGEDRHIGRFRGPARIRGRRRRSEPLRALVTTDLGLAAALEAGARVDPDLAWQALPYAIPPSWTAGLVFTVAATVADGRPWYLTARDGGGLASTKAEPAEPPAASVALSRAAFDRMLRDQPHPHGDRPAVRGDHGAVTALVELLARLRG